jgi:predicted PurR-regulated permease PerM
MADSAIENEEHIEEQQLEVAEDSQLELRSIRRYLMLTFLMALLTAVYFARDVLLPILVAVVLTLTLLPIVRLGSRLRIPTGVTAVVLMLMVTLSVAAGGYFLSGPVQTMVADAPRMVARIEERISGLVDQVRDIAEQAEQVTAAVAPAPAQGDLVDANGDGVASEPVVAVVDESSAGPGMATTVLTSVASAGGTIIAALLLTGFLLASGDFYHRRIVEAAPRLRDKKKALTIIRDVERQISRYLGAITLINIGLGLAVGTSMWLLGMPMPALWGVLAFLLNYIPFIGAIVGVLLAAAVGIVTFDNLTSALLPAVAYFAINSFEGNVVTPMLVGRRLEINTVAMLLAVAFWMWLWGIPGAILAVPFLVVVKAISDNVESLQTLSSFLSAEPGDRPNEVPQKATTGPALTSAPFRTQAEVREESPPTVAPGESNPPDRPLAAE